MQLFTKADFAIAFLRVVCIPFIMIYSCGLLKGLTIYFGTRYILKEVVARRLLNAEPLGTMDEFFMYDSK
jgi:alkylation response protein AidB-like acyl-CoA dehydrogenase